MLLQNTLYTWVQLFEPDTKINVVFWEAQSQGLVRIEGCVFLFHDDPTKNNKLYVVKVKFWQQACLFFWCSEADIIFTHIFGNDGSDYLLTLL